MKAREKYPNLALLARQPSASETYSQAQQALDQIDSLVAEKAALIVLLTAAWVRRDPTHL